MKEASAQSPFAALTPKEQKEQWICWQSQHQEKMKPIMTDLKSESERTRVKPTAKPIHHDQYDAVVRRLRKAQQNTSGFTSCRTTTQPSSGS